MSRDMLWGGSWKKHGTVIDHVMKDRTVEKTSTRPVSIPFLHQSDIIS